MHSSPADQRHPWVLLGQGESHTPATWPARHYLPTVRERARAAAELGRPLPPDAWAVRLWATEVEVSRLLYRDRALLCAFLQVDSAVATV